MFSRWTFLLALLSLSGLGLLTYDLFRQESSALAVTGLSLIALTSLGYALSLRHLQRSVFRSAMATYAERQMHRESNERKATFDAPSAAA